MRAARNSVVTIGIVERTHAWFTRFRRLPIHYERRADIYEAFTSLAARIMTLNQIRRLC